MRTNGALRSVSRFIILAIVLGIAVHIYAFSTEETTSKVKTTKFFIFQKPSVLLTPTSDTTSFTVFIGEQNPVIKDAYIELRGVSKVTASQNLTVDINQSDVFPTAREQQFVFDSSGSPHYFRFLYTGVPAQTLTSYLAGIITNPGTFTFFLKTAISGADVSLLQARLVITYSFTPPSAGGLPPTGNVVSSTFDTLTSNGATFNSILWKGTKPVGTRVRLQFATSNISTGPFSFIGGTSCTASDYYEPNANTPAALGCFSTHHNKRYFRYKVIECSSSDCATAGAQTPQVDDVIVNWSP